MLEPEGHKLKVKGCKLEAEGEMLPTSIQNLPEKLPKSIENGPKMVFGRPWRLTCKRFGQDIAIQVKRSPEKWRELFDLGRFWEAFGGRLGQQKPCIFL